MRLRALAAGAAFVVASLLTAQVHAEELEVSIAYVPAKDAEALVIEQPLGRLTVRAWDDDQVKIVARKRAVSEAGLDRLKVNVELSGRTIRVRTGVRLKDGFRAIPPPAEPGPGPAIDLTIDAPRHVALQARTWAGDLEATGFRAGAQLASSGGEVRASEIEGPVRTSALSGRQQLRSIRGDVEADGVSGDLELIAVDGTLLVARVVDGRITAREVRTPTVRLYSTTGGIVLIGSLRLGAKWEVASHDGDVRVVLQPAPFTLHARAPLIRTGLVLGGAAPAEAHGQLDGMHRGGGPELHLASDRGTVTVEPAPAR